MLEHRGFEAPGRLCATFVTAYLRHGVGRGRSYLFSPCPGGETGRRKGLKILFPATGVWVQFPPRAPTLTSLRNCSDLAGDGSRRVPCQRTRLRLSPGNGERNCADGHAFHSAGVSAL